MGYQASQEHIREKNKILNDFEVDVSQQELREIDIQLFQNLGCISRSMVSRKREVTELLQSVPLSSHLVKYVQF